ncbi:translesion DNA synthesis-associated protein ImuA [Pseudoalteromonas luteoviolacea]|uniref:Recombinase RecA n=1 Tax=Pseudoalteromonas luteoviolacea S4054 TaxID=1129367 RepID=A0A0F6A7K9_9GAMM|nr:translesion DNA synthesis-associated protein ImuA [Pseudoalteromonas luteoviolacea]AOT09315.1 hypothetical protein S4054249_16320 [Pseudoalteromonas luteoviolacea]AOT14227.1 hypothetical protein S40542_16290 [Pseudoalteromonas luteoviolacea]AOT19143.1 hypothetical protein S4054_16295 [Pseudoalteromonas luteoviolacea]KKE82113.1 hypothetical protein N479_19960 [Pseudoalteromonas luteoviolacea S4054]
MANLIDFLQHQNLVWHGTDNAPLSQRSVEKQSTGYETLDTCLEGGFPIPGIVDIQCQVGIGEVALLLPFIREQSRLCVMINPPANVNAHALLHQNIVTELVWVLSISDPTEALWAAEQCLKSGVCSSVLLWHQELQIHQVKRLILSAQTGQSLCCLLRCNPAQGGSLPVSLSMQLSPRGEGLDIKVTKLKGGWAKPKITLTWPQLWPQLILRDESEQSGQVLPFVRSISR